MKGYRHDDPVTAAALPYKQRDAEKKIATKQKRIETKLESELEGFFKPDTIFDAEAREAARELQEGARETLLAGTATWRDLHEEVAAIRKGDMDRAAALKPELVAEAAPEAVATGDVLYQGHKGPGIGYLKTDLPERRDGDGDTVVAERRPRQSDLFDPSPMPVPPRLRGGRRPKAPKPKVELIATKTERKRRRIPSHTLQKMEPSKRRKADAVGDMVKTFVLSEHFMRAVKEFFGAQMGNGHQTTRRKGREATTAAGGLGRRRGGTI